MVTQRHVRKDPLDILAEQAVIEEETKPACCHHWVIETANGPVSWGGCARSAMKARSSKTP